MEIGGRLLAGARKHRKGLFSAGFWSDQLVSWTMKDPSFRTQLFRFIDVFPMLRSPEQIHDYLSDYLSQPGVTLPTGLDLGMKAGRLAKGLVAKTITDRHRRPWRAISSPAPTPRPPCPCSATCGSKAWPSASTCSARPASARPRPRSTSAATSICWRSCPRKSAVGRPSRVWRTITSAPCRGPASRSRSAP